MIEDRDESQKSAQGNPGAAGVLAEQLEPRSRAALQDEGSHRASIPHPDSSTPQSLSPLSLVLPLSRVLEFPLKSRSPLRNLLRPQNTAASPSHLSPGSPGLTWGRGPALPTAPSSRSARRSRLGVRAMAGRSGLGHSCHLRNRAPRLIPAGLRGEELAWGRPARPREGSGGVPVLFRLGFRRPGSQAGRQSPGPGDAERCAPCGRHSGSGAAGAEPPALSARGVCAWPARCDHWGPPPAPAPRSPPDSPSTKESHIPTESVPPKAN